MAGRVLSPPSSPGRPAIPQSGHCSSLETSVHWTEGTGLTGCSEGSCCLALYAHRLPVVTGWSLRSRALVFLLHEDLLERAARSMWQHRQPSSQALTGGRWRKALWLTLSVSSIWRFLLFPGPSEAPTHFSVTSSGQKASSAVLWSCCSGPMLAHYHLMDVPGSPGPNHSIPGCSSAPPPLPPAAWQLGPRGLWGCFHRKGQALRDCHVFSVQPSAPSESPCVLLSPEQNVNRHQKAKGIEYLFYP